MDRGSRGQAGNVESGDEALKLFACVLAALAVAGVCVTGTKNPADKTEWPGKNWAMSTPEKVGLDGSVLKALDADFKDGKYPLVDSFAVFRCGKEVFARKYGHDYGQI